MIENSKDNEKSEIDIKNVLKALGSQLRTDILSQLASGDKYVLQLVKTLNKSQQDIHRNLNYLERLGIVKSYSRKYEDYRNEDTKPSKGRRYFTIDHSFMLQINLAPNHFNLKFQTVPLEHVKIDKSKKSEIKTSNIKNVQKKNLNELSMELKELNDELEELEVQQQDIFIRQSLIRNQIVDQIEQHELNPFQLLVLERIIGKLPVKTEDLAEELNYNPNYLLGILKALQEHNIPIKEHNNHWSI
jgi:predicted transcriptional regulator